MIDPDDFFETPRSTSILKYKILNYYLSQYFHKVNRYYRSAAIAADLFAGKGRFESGEEGSPIIMAKYAKIARSQYGFENKVILAEAIPRVRSELFNNVKDYFIDGIVEIVHGNANDAGSQLLERIIPRIPLFILLDPFGIKGLSMNLLSQILERAREESTEILITFNHNGLARHIGRAKNIGSGDPRKNKPALSSTKIMNDALGGEWWKEIYANESLPEDQRLDLIRQQYIALIEPFFANVGVFGVTAGFPDEPVKYYLIFGTRSPKAFELMNDSIKKSMEEFVEELIREYNIGTLFEQVDQSVLVPSRYRTDFASLTRTVLNECRIITQETCRERNGFREVFLDRQKLRMRLIKKYFANYSTTEYNKAIEKLLKDGYLVNPENKKRISDQGIFKVVVN